MGGLGFGAGWSGSWGGGGMEDGDQDPWRCRRQLQLHCFKFLLCMSALTFGSTIKTEMYYCDVITEDSRMYHVFVRFQ